jgi:hypothetical protein
MQDTLKRLREFLRGEALLTFTGVQNNFLLILAGVIIFGLIYLFFWDIPTRQLGWNRAHLTTKEFYELKNGIRATFVQALGGTAILIGLFFTWRNLRVTEKSQRHQLRLAALDKRLEVHQQAYTLWWKLMGDLEKEGKEVRERAIECEEWWVNNCIYLDGEAGLAFSRACSLAVERSNLLAAARNEAYGVDVNERLRKMEEARKKWKLIFEVGPLIRQAVELPSLGEDEYKPIGATKAQDGQPAKPNAADR